MVSPTPSTPEKSRARRSNWPLVAIFLVCLAPVVLAVLAYYVPWMGLRPAETSAYGHLITPQRPLPSRELLSPTTLDGEPFDLNSLKGKWILISADQGACPESCVKKLFTLRNSHASQGKDVQRLSRVWFVTDQTPIPAPILEAYKGTHMLRADPARLAAYLAPDATGANIAAALDAPMWIIDPLGNLMMEFPADADSIEVRDDIRKLLRTSQIG